MSFESSPDGILGRLARCWPKVANRADRWPNGLPDRSSAIQPRGWSWMVWKERSVLQFHCGAVEEFAIG